MITIVLVGIENAGNLGAIARVMKNFGQQNLILINPACDPENAEAQGRAQHARDILKKAKVDNFTSLKKFDLVIGTTAKNGTEYNIPRLPLSPEQLSKKIAPLNANTAFVFGRESSGLTNVEVQHCDFLVTIPTSADYPTMNISHSVAIILYELCKHQEVKKFNSMSEKDKETILKKVDNILSKMHFATPQKKETQRKVWKSLITKAMLTKREAFALLGFLRKLE
ncbi:MAG: RNA methyltransferase [Candidatus Woesearchaeota archaeon]